jgi:hypothetical protein
MFQAIEPFYGWLHLYSHDQDEASPFHEVEHSLFEYNRKIYTFDAHPLWDSIESESLLVKILYADYTEGFAILELFGEWNDLHENDFRLLSENCLQILLGAGINKFILICENVFNVHLDSDDYYADLADELEDGWLCLLRARKNVLEEFDKYNISPYFYWNRRFDDLKWRKMLPWQVYELVRKGREQPLIGSGG